MLSPPILFITISYLAHLQRVSVTVLRGGRASFNECKVMNGTIVTVGQLGQDSGSKRSPGGCKETNGTNGTIVTVGTAPWEQEIFQWIQSDQWSNCYSYDCKPEKVTNFTFFTIFTERMSN